MPKSFFSIQLLRFVAAFLVALSHAAYVTAPYWESQSIGYYFYFGGCGVHIFFVISGFVMVVSSDGLNPNEFLVRRAIRIFPIYWIYAAAYMAYSGIPQDAVLGLALLPGHSSSIIGQGWTLSYEVFFYICFAAIIPLGMIGGGMALTIFFVALISLRWLIKVGPFTDLVTNSLLLEFIAGMWVATLLKLWGAPSLRASVLLVVFGVGGFAGGIILGYTGLPSVIVWGVPSALLVAGCACLEWQAKLPVFLAKLSFLGDSSYSLYLLHSLLFSVIVNAAAPLIQFGGPIRVISCIWLAVVCTLVSACAYALIEKRLVLSLRWLAVPSAAQ